LGRGRGRRNHLMGCGCEVEPHTIKRIKFSRFWSVSLPVCVHKHAVLGQSPFSDHGNIPFIFKGKNNKL
jgi:hypothetical protein